MWLDKSVEHHHCWFFRIHTSIQEIRYTLDTIEKNTTNTVSDPVLTCLRNFAESYERNIPMQFVSQFLSISGICNNLAPSNYGSVNSSLAQITYANTVPLKMLTRASAEVMEMQLMRDMKNMRTYTVGPSPACVPVKFNVETNAMDFLINAQLLDYCNTVIEGSRRHNIEVSPYIESKMKDGWWWLFLLPI